FELGINHMGEFFGDLDCVLVDVIRANARTEGQWASTGDFRSFLGVVVQIRKLLHNPQTRGRCNLANGFVACLLVIAPGTGLAGHWERANAVDDLVIAIHVAVQAARFAVGNNVDTGTVLVENGNVDGVTEQFLEIIWTPIALLVEILTGVPPAGPAVETYHGGGEDGQVAHWPLSFPT